MHSALLLCLLPKLITLRGLEGEVKKWLACLDLAWCDTKVSLSLKPQDGLKGPRKKAPLCLHSLSHFQGWCLKSSLHLHAFSIFALDVLNFEFPGSLEGGPDPDSQRKVPFFFAFGILYGLRQVATLTCAPG